MEARYDYNLNELLNNNRLCNDNKELLIKFFAFQERKLKRINNISSLDVGCYKTLLSYVQRINNVLLWFNHKSLKELTKEDIQLVYDNLEDGVILNSNGKPFKDRRSYYTKVFRSKLFKLAGKDEIAREVMEFYRPKEDNVVRYITEEDFVKLVGVMVKSRHKLLAWLSFDIGENVNSLLRLKKQNFHRSINKTTQQPEYKVDLDSSILKRSRTTRSEITNYQQTVDHIDMVLKGLKRNDYIFDFKYSASKKAIDRACSLSAIRCRPKGQLVTWKDLRSSMACDLLSKDWTRDEVNARLGHKPSSSEIDKYINYLAIGRHKPKKKIHDYNINKLKQELDEAKQREVLNQRRNEEQQEQNNAILEEMNHMREMIIKSMQQKDNINVTKKKKDVATAIKSLRKKKENTQ